MLHTYNRIAALSQPGRRWLPVLALFSLMMSSLTGWAQSTTVVISQVYGAGGNNATSTYRNDFVEIFNKSGAAVSLTGWTVQYGSAAGLFTSSFALSGTIAAGKYALIQLGTGGNATPPLLPTPDFTGATNISTTAGKVALANNNTTVVGPSSTNVVDYLGYGATASTFEGAAPTPAPSNTNSVFRASSGCTDTDQNGTDFAAAVASARNSASPTNTCATITVGSMTGFPACVTGVTSAAVTIPFTSTGAVFTGSVTYTAQLSNSSGSFAAPVSLGTVTNNLGPGTYSIGGTVPAGTADGTGYRVRIVTTTPAVTGTNSAAQTIAQPPTSYTVSLTSTAAQTFCTTASGASLTASGTSTSPASSTGFTYQWKYGTASGGPYGTAIGGATSATYLPTGSDFGGGVAGTYYLIAQATSTCGAVVQLSSQVVITTTTPIATAVVKQGATTYPSSGAAYSYGSVSVGGSSAAIPFTIQNTGCAVLNLGTLTATGDFSVSTPVSSTVAANGGTTTFTATFSPTAVGALTGTVSIPSNDPTTPYTLNLSGTGTPSAASDVIANGTFTYNTTGIVYASLQGATITNTSNLNSVAVYSVTVRDGGGAADPDALPTILDALTFSSVAGTAAIRSAALFTSAGGLVSNSPVINVGANTIAFPGLVALLTPGGNVSRVTAADGNSFNLFLRVTFNNTAAVITDNQQLLFSVTAAGAGAASSGSSTFAPSPTFATITSSSAANDNRLNAIATQLVFAPAPPTTAAISTNFTVGVVARDANNVPDINFRNLVGVISVPSATLTISGGGGVLSSATGLTQTLTGGSFTWTDVQYTLPETGLTLSTTNTGSLTNPTAPMDFINFVGILWDGGAGDGLWSSANNWANNVVPTAADAVWLSHSSISSAYTVTVSTPGAVARSLRIGDSGNPITLLLSGTPATDLLTVGGATGFDLSVTQGGVLNNNANPSVGATRALAFANAADTWEMTGDGTYQHRQGTGTMPNIVLGNTTFASTSNFEVYSLVSAFVMSGTPGILGKIRTYGNLALTPTGVGVTANLNLSLAATQFLHVRGNLTLLNTGLVQINQSNTGATGVSVRVGGNLNIGAGSTLYVSDGGTSLADSLVVRGNISGTGVLAGGKASGDAGAVLVGGSLTGVQYAALSNLDRLTFGGGAAPVVDFNPSTAPASNVRFVTVQSGKELRLLRNMAQTGSAANRITVNSGATFNFNGFNVTGNGGFTLLAGGTLKITDPAGISASGATGNIQNASTRTLPNGATYWYTGTGAQATGDGVPATLGTKNIICDNPTALTLTNPLPASGTGVEVRIQTPGRLEIKQGIFIETATAEIFGTGNLTMSGGTYRLVKGVAAGTPPELPQLTGTYTLTGGAIELAGSQIQGLRATTPTSSPISYFKLRFKNAGTKLLSSAISNVVDSVVIARAAILDLTQSRTGAVGSVGLSGSGGLQMTGTSQFLISETGTQPGMTGGYALTGGLIKFSNSGATAQTIRGNQLLPVPLNRTYFNIDVTGTNVGMSSGNFAIASGATMTVKSAAVFSMDDQAITGAGSFVLESASTLKYGSPQGITLFATGGTGTTAGNIRVSGARTFVTTASYVLQGTGASVTGDGLPATVAGLTISKSAALDVATLTSATTVTGAFTLTQGLLGLGNNDLTLPATATLTGGAATSYVQTTNSPTATGELVRPVANTNTDVVFPVGTSTYTPVRLRQALTATTDNFRVRVFNGARLGGFTGALAPTDVVNRTWDVTEATPGGSNATLTVQWNTVDEAPNFDRIQCTVAHFASGAWHHRVRDYLPATVVTANVWSRARSGLTSFSPFAVQDYQQVLPVELTRFAASLTPKRTVDLTWATASEKNADRFEVQRAANGREFVTIGTVAAHGTSILPNAYAFTDAQPLAGVSYYRLRQVDTDGTEHFSQQAVVRVDGPAAPAAFTAYPTAFASELHLSIETPTAGKAQVTISDLSGRLVLAQTLTVEAGSTIAGLPATARLTPGLYVVRVALPGGAVLRQRVVKE